MSVDARVKPGHDELKREAGESGLLLVLMPPYRFQSNEIAAALARLTALQSAGVWLALVPYYRGDDKRRLARLQADRGGRPRAAASPATTCCITIPKAAARCRTC